MQDTLTLKGQFLWKSYCYLQKKAHSMKADTAETHRNKKRCLIFSFTHTYLFFQYLIYNVCPFTHLIFYANLCLINSQFPAGSYFLLLTIILFKRILLALRQSSLVPFFYFILIQTSMFTMQISLYHVTQFYGCCLSLLKVHLFSQVPNMQTNMFLLLFVIGIIRTQEILDRETTSHYWLTIYATDQGIVPLSSFVEVYIEVQDVNDNAPLTSEPVYFPSLSENSPKDVSVIQIQAFDPDTNSSDNLSFQITSGNPQGFFAINSQTGKFMLCMETSTLLHLYFKNSHENFTHIYFFDFKISRYGSLCC